MREYFIWLAKIITILLMIVVVVPLMIGVVVGTSAVLTTKGGSHIGDLKPGNKNVAVVELLGEIEDTKEVITQLYDNANDSSIAGIVLRVDSPGGQVAPSQDIYRAVEKLKSKKPIVASMGSVAASGGFYAAIGGSKVFAQPGTMTGSIGVIMQIPNVEKVSQLVGVDMITIRSGTLKDAGNMFRAMTSEERTYLENVTSEVHRQFVADIATARKLPVDAVKTFSDGRIILGSQAKELGLVDAFGDINDAARMVFELKGQKLNDDEQPNLIYHQDKFKDLKKLLRAAQSLPKFFTKSFGGVPELRYQLTF